MSDYPIRLTVTDDLKRNRVTVFFRLILIIPHVIWFFLWAIAAAIAAIVNWFATLIVGQSPAGLHEFIARFARYSTHVSAYFFLLANDYPKFTGEAGYAVDLEIDPPAPQPRWSTFLRIFLAIPAIAISTALTGGGGGGGRSNNSGGPLQVVGFLGWFVSLVRGEMALGMRDLGAYTLGYSAQAWGYLFLLTDRYPNSDPALIGSPAPLPDHPVRMRVSDDRRRSRLTVFFRLLLGIPHIIWLFLWGIVATIAVIINWFATLFTGRSPDSLHGFLAKYVRYQTHVSAYLLIVANRFPGFAAEPYDIDLDIAPSERQNRWITGFRAILVIPALALSSGISGVLFLIALFGWFASLITGRMPEGLRNLGAYGLRYSAQVTAYAYVLTEQYPYSGPPALSADAPGGPNEPASSELGVGLAA
ncbi:MAG: DUF4389 domain-containing protein [Gaiellaceae bacterium]